MQCAITFCYLGWVAGKVRLEAILAVLPAFCFAGFVGGALVAAGISLGAIGPGQASSPGEAVNWTLAFAVSALSLCGSFAGRCATGRGRRHRQVPTCCERGDVPS